MGMSRKEFERLAEEISNCPRFNVGDNDFVAVYDIIQAISDACAASNPSFQRAKFYNAARTPGYRAKYGASAYES